MLHNITSHKTKHKPLLYVTWHNMRQLNWYNVTNRNKTSSEKKQQNAIVLPTQHNHNTSRSRNLFVLQEKHYLSWAVGITRAAGGGGGSQGIKWTGEACARWLEEPKRQNSKGTGECTWFAMEVVVFRVGDIYPVGSPQFFADFLGGFGRRFKNSQNNMILKWLIL